MVLPPETPRRGCSSATPGAKPCCRRILRIHMQQIVFWGGAGSIISERGVTPRVSVSGTGHQCQVVKHSQPHALGQSRLAARGELSSGASRTSRARTHFRAQSKFTKEPHAHLHAAHMLQARSGLTKKNQTHFPRTRFVRPGLHQTSQGRAESEIPLMRREALYQDTQRSHSVVALAGKVKPPARPPHHCTCNNSVGGQV